MREIIATLSFFLTGMLLPGISVGQIQQEHTITWEQPSTVPVRQGDAITMLKFKGANYHAEFFYLPVFQIEIPGKMIRSFRLEDFIHVRLSEEELRLIEDIPVGDHPEIYKKVLVSGDTYITRIGILPFMKDPRTGEVSKILSFVAEYEVGEIPSAPGRNLRKSELGNSVLSQGTWYKLAVLEDGIYKIDYAYLKSMGIPVENIDPRNIRLFGNAGGMLPQANNIERPEDLTENHIEVVGELDGRFDQQDYILFFGKGPHSLELKENGGAVNLEYHHHDYSDTSFYFITAGNEPGMRVSARQDLGAGYPMINTFDYLFYYEMDQYNILVQWGSGSGREWYGEIFRIKTSYDFEVPVPDLVPNSSVRVISAVMAQSYTPSFFRLSLNNADLGEQEMDVIPNSTYGIKGRERLDEFEISSASLGENPEKLVLRYNFTRGNSTLSDGYLDYFNIWCMGELKTYADQVRFRSVASLINPVSTFEIRDTGESMRIWDISDPLRPVIQEVSSLGDSHLFGAETSTLKEFVMFNLNNAKTPVRHSVLSNQDLRGMSTPSLLIITHPLFLPAAERLAAHRKQHGINAEVVDVFKIYNEFSSGRQDVTAIRDFVKYLYDNNNRLASLLLFGRGSFDYKDRLSFNTNFVPIYESRNSLHPIYSYSSDDFYGFMDDDEGEWAETFFGDHAMDIGVGRLPVKSLAEAHTVVDKIILYETNENCYGPWRNNIYFVADDGDGTDGTRHSKDADRLSVQVDTAFSNFNIRKIYIDAYEQIIQAGMEEAPEVNEAIRNAVKNGALLINFTGHGSENQWTRENIVNISSINQWDNIFKLPLLVTATCEFGRHDDPQKISGAEYALINDRGGAIGLVTTARPVFASTNFILNQSFYDHVFHKVDGKYQTLGEIFRKTKNTSLNGSVNRNFSLLGDPSMKLAYPEREIVLDKINERVLTQGNDTLKALKKVEISGMVRDPDHQILNGYNGILTATVFDKAQVKQTLGTQDPVMVYTERNGILFRGDASINNGKFIFEFVVPKNLDCQIGEGKVSLYAIDVTTGMDASGSNLDLMVGGIPEDLPADNIPPDAVLYLEDTTFQFGDLTSDHPNLIADIFDENGINLLENETSKGMVVILDDQQEYVVNQFYKANLDDYRFGRLVYQLSELEEGRHTVLLKVMDTHENLTEAYTEFIVGEDNSLILQHVLNYPNPFTDETRFSFEHNRSGENLSVRIEIFSSKGQLVKTIVGETKYSEFRVNDITWDGRGESGQKLESGLYIYRVFVRSLVDGAKNTEYEKLVLIK
jgi:hypothetical protein